MPPKKRGGLMRKMSSAVLGVVTKSEEPEEQEQEGLVRLSSARRKELRSEAVQRDITEMFECFDSDRSNALDSEEFCDALSMLSIHLDARGMRELFDEIDTSDSGDLDQDEWVTMMSRSRKLLLGQTGPRITAAEARNVVKSVLLDTAHRRDGAARKIQANWRGKAIRNERNLSAAERQQRMQQRLSQRRLDTVTAEHQALLANSVSWKLVQPGCSRLGVGGMTGITEKQARAMYQMCRPRDERGEGEQKYQDIKPIEEFSEQLYELLIPEGHSHPPLFVPEDSDEVALWRTLIRRYLWLNLMHNTINDSKIMHGARGQSQEVEQERDIKNQIAARKCFFQADVGFRARWDLVQVFVLLVTAIVVPMRVGFDALDQMDPNFWFGFDLITDVYFYVDIVLNCRTAYVDDNNKLVAEPKTVLVHYLRSWFIVDLVSCLPVNYFFYATGTLPLPWNLDTDDQSVDTDLSAIKVLKVLRLFRLTKMLRVLKLKNLAEKYQDSPVYQTFLSSFKLIKLIFLLLYLSHFLACFWYLVGSQDQDVSEFSTRYGWVNRNYNDGTWHKSSSGPTPHNTLRDQHLITHYVTALFHSLTDFGMDLAETDAEMSYVSFQHIIYEAFMAYLTGVLAGEVIVGNAAKQKYSEKMGEIREFMQHHNISKNLRTQVTTFYEHLNAKKTFFDEQAVLTEFPPNIRKKIVAEIYGARSLARSP